MTFEAQKQVARATIAEALNIDPETPRVWRIDDQQYVYTPRSETSMTFEVLTRQRILGAPIDSPYLTMGRLHYLNVGWAKKNAALFAQ